MRCQTRRLLRGALTLHALAGLLWRRGVFPHPAHLLMAASLWHATTADLVQVVEETTGQQWDGFFQGWLLDPTMPPIPQMNLAPPEL